MIVEKNDVDISKLFIWGKSYNIKNEVGEIEATIFMRLLGDADVNRARVYALRKSRELRLKLLDANSDERILYIQTMQELTKEDLVNYIVTFSMREITNKAYKEVSVPRPKEPKANASLKKMEDYQKELDEYPNKFGQAIRKYILAEVENLKKFIANESMETLYKRYIDSLIEEFCEIEALHAYNEYEIFLGCYKDDDYSVRAWETFEKYDNLPKKVKDDFRAAYDTLKMGTDELKKLQEATR